MKSAISKYLGPILLAIYMLTVCTPLLSAQDNQVKRVLVLHSYHRGLSWDEAIDRGIESVLKKENLEIDIQTEYMDTKRIYDSTYIGKLHDIYKYKFRNRRFDVIIISDNNALDFLIKYRDTLFPDTPVVFCGVNYFKDTDLAGKRLFTGVVESSDMKETIEMALKIHPDTKQLIVINDKVVTGQLHKKSLLEIIPHFKNTIKFIFYEDIDIKEIQEKAQRLPKDSLILLMSLYRDRYGNILSYKDCATLISKKSPVPIYSFWDIYLGYGIIGGKLTSGYHQGELAGKITLRILSGEKASNIPVVKVSPNRYMFDYKQMQRFGVNLSDLPKESIVINKPYSFYSKHKRLIWLIIASVAGLTFIILLLVTNIIIRKRSEEALKESEGKYRSLVNNVQIGIFRSTPGPTGKFLEVNPAMEEITGYSREELLRMNVSDLYMRPEERKAVLEEMAAVVGKKTRELNFREKIGTEMVVLDTKFAVRDNTGRILYFDGILEDITENKKLEAQLLQAQKMEAIGTLAGGIAHDFNNLLMAIQGRASIMLMNKDSSHSDFGHLRGIEDHVESAAELTKQLLGFARGGKYEVTPTDLNELIKKQNRMFGRTKKEIIINGKYEENLWSVEIDRGQIEQVLLNLYVNAWQAMPGGGDLYLETENVTLNENYVKPFSIERGRYVKISVTDTGVGMDKATQERIFDPFFTTKEMGRGTGLGLASAYGIVKNHGGFINVYSEKGHGTTFNVYLPVSEKEAIKEKGFAEEALKGKETIFLVEDEDMIIDVGEEMLENLGYKVLSARTGKDAIEIYEKNKDKIDIIILDMVMPGMGGGETYDRLKQINPGIKVLLSSGYSINGQATEILERGCNGFIQKPFNMTLLSQRIREILGTQ